MRIRIKLVGAFQVGRFKEECCDYPAGITAADVIEALQLSRPLLGTVLVNGVHAELDTVLRDGDSLTILPLVDGG